MASVPAGVLTTDDILTRSQQYDAELVFHADVSGLQIRSLGTALTVCASLTILNVSKNKLTTLEGLQAVGATLQYLDAAENSIADISALQKCTSLRRAVLYGNQIRDMQSLHPLKCLSALRELSLRAEIHLDGDTEPLVLDNPLCSYDVSEYRTKCYASLPQLEWLDNRLVAPNLFLQQCKQNGAEALPPAKAQANLCIDGMKRVTADTLKEKSSHELTLEKILSASKSL